MANQITFNLDEAAFAKMDALLAKLPIEHRTKAMENAIVDALERRSC